MTRIAISIKEIGRVMAGDQTLFIRPKISSFAKVEPGAQLWLAEPFHLERRFDGKAPTVALSLGAQPAFAADHLFNPAALAKTHGARHPARSLCRDWHRAHLRVTSRAELRLQDLTEADLAALGFRTATAFAGHWDVEAQLSGIARFRWRDNPQVLAFGFALVRQPLTFPSRPEPVKRGPNPRVPRPAPRPATHTAPALAAETLPAADAVVQASREFAARHAAVRKLSATLRNPIDLGERSVRSISADQTLPLPSLAEREAGVCARCGSRLAFGCSHHPLIKENAA